METRCPNCGSPITLDELTRGTCSSCNAVLPHVVRAHEQAIAQRLAQRAPAPPPLAVPAPPRPRLPPGPPRPASRSTLLLTALYGLITVAVMVGTGYLFKRPDAAPAATTTAPPSPAEIRFHRCSQRPFSRGSTAAVTIGVTNDTSERLSINSVEPGQPPITVPVPPGTTVMHRTFVMHPWMVQNEALECQGWFVPNQGGALTLRLSAVRAAR